MSNMPTRMNAVKHPGVLLMVSLVMGFLLAIHAIDTSERSNLAYADAILPVEVCFPPKGKCDERVFAKLDEAFQQNPQTRIRENAYVITNPQFSTRFEAFAVKGADVRLMYDQACMGAYLAKSCKVGKMPHVQSKMITLKKGEDHNKYTIIGDYLVITGSANPTVQAYKDNWENVLFIYDKTVIQQYIADFDSHWSQP